jgi:hypothetical protein
MGGMASGRVKLGQRGLGRVEVDSEKARRRGLVMMTKGNGEAGRGRLMERVEGERVGDESVRSSAVDHWMSRWALRKTAGQ